MESLGDSVIQRLCQLVKYNSIEGKKQVKVDVVYTHATNLLKTDNMDVGTVGYKNPKLVKTV